MGLTTLGKPARFLIASIHSYRALGRGLVIGISAGLLAPVVGAGLGAASTTIRVTDTTSFLVGTGGAAMITTGGILTGSSIAGKGMA
jgi:hypothetical protein